MPVLPGERFELLEEEGKATLRKLKRAPPLIVPAVLLVLASGALPLVVGGASAMAPLFPGIFLVILIFVKTNPLAGRGFYFRVERELVIERSAAGSYRDAGGALRVMVDGKGIDAPIRDVVVRATPTAQQPAWQVYVLLGDGGVIHVVGTVQSAEAGALRAAIRAAAGLPEDKSPPKPDVVGLGAVLLAMLMLLASIPALVGIAVWATEIGRQDPLRGGALCAGGTLAVLGLMAAGIAVLARPGMRKWARMQLDR